MLPASIALRLGPVKGKLLFLKTSGKRLYLARPELSATINGVTRSCRGHEFSRSGVDPGGIRRAAQVTLIRPSSRFLRAMILLSLVMASISFWDLRSSPHGDSQVLQPVALQALVWFVTESLFLRIHGLVALALSCGCHQNASFALAKGQRSAAVAVWVALGGVGSLSRGLVRAPADGLV